MNSRKYATLTCILILFAAVPTLCAEIPVSENSSGSEDTSLSNDSAIWDATKEEEMNLRSEQLRQRSRDLSERSAELNNRIPELNEQMRLKMAETQEKVEQAQLRMAEAQEKSRQAQERVHEAIRNSRIASSNWDRKLRGEVAQDEIQEEFPVTQDISLVVDTEFALIDIRAEERETIFVHAIRKAEGETEEEARENLESVSLIVEQDGTDIRITGGLEGSSDKWMRRIEVSVVLPSNVKIEVENKFGSVNVEGLQADVTITNGFAPVVVKNTKGALNIHAEYGEVSVSEHAGGGGVQAGFGNLTIDGWSGRLDAKNSYANTTLRNLTITDNINIKNQFAAIRVDLKKDTNANLSAKTTFGKIRCDIPMKGENAGTQLEATLGRGGPSIEILNSYGDILLAGDEVDISNVALRTDAPYKIPKIPPIPKIPKMSTMPSINIPEIHIDIPDIASMIAETAQSSSNHGSETYSEEWTIPLEDAARIRKTVITHDHGDISVIGADSGPYEIRAKRRIWAESEERAREIASQYSLKVSSARSTLEVEGIRPDSLPSGVKGARVDVDYVLTIPENMDLEADADHGDFEATDITGDVVLEHDHGNVSLEQIHGKISSDCDHGEFRASRIAADIEIKHDHGNLTMSNIEGKIICESDHGNVTAENVSGEVVVVEHDHGQVILKNVHGKIRCKNENGDTRLDSINGPLTLEFSDGNARIIGAETLVKDWEIKGTHGHCYIVLPRDAGVSLLLQTEKGKIQTSKGIQVEREKHREWVKTDLNGGGIPVRITVTKGNINLE
ncbi:MAG: DUF4097 family beta strand repeat-containing protein [bacterium]